MKKFFDWLDDRSGYRATLAHALEEPVPGGASYAYVFGSVLTFILILQMATGVFLAMYYSPSASDAWGSVAHIQDQVTLGWFIRGLHSYGASAMVIIAGLHMLQTAVWGAYKKPRELNWIVGVLMLALILAFALTGYLLPWDQTGYWATKVATGIAGTTPVAGVELQQAVQGGNEYGNLTLTRFFAIHVFILPGVLILLLVGHIALFRRHGVTPHWWKSKKQLEAKTQPFWPDQLFRDTVACAVVFAIMVGVNIYTHGVKLDAPADPSSNFDARPEWYFRALFQVLKYFEGTMEHVVALGTPAVVGGFLLALPFLDRGPSRSPKNRIVQLALLALGTLVAVALTVASFREDASNPAMQERLEVAEQQAAEARRLARENGVPAAGGIAVFTTAEHYFETRLWQEHCATCHVGDKYERKGPAIGPGYNSRDWIRAFLKNPSGDEFFGVTEITDMDPVDQTGAELDALVEYIYAQTGADDADEKLAAKGKELADESCSDCHAFDGHESGEGPNLGGRGSVEWFAAIIADASRPHLFGEKNEMAKFDIEKLSAADRFRLAEYLVWMRTAEPSAAGSPSAPARSDEPTKPAQGDGDEADTGQADGGEANTGEDEDETDAEADEAEADPDETAAEADEE